MIVVFKTGRSPSRVGPVSTSEGSSGKADIGS
jgi:hypothetical protein